MEKRKNISLVRKIEVKKVHYFMYANTTKKVKTYHPRAVFIIFYNSSTVFTLWKWGETSSTTSLLLIRTSSD